LKIIALLSDAEAIAKQLQIFADGKSQSENNYIGATGYNTTDTIIIS